MFFAIHDPTTRNRQGADAGTQYRSVIFFHSPQQKETAEQVIGELNRGGVWKQPIVTEVTPAPAFFKAEDYHQEYYRSNPTQPYCQAVVAPKVSKVREYFAAKIKEAKS